MPPDGSTTSPSDCSRAFSRKAVELAERILAGGRGEWLRSDLPRYLARSGRTEDARTLVERNLQEDPDDPYTLFDAGMAWVEIGDSSLAERCYREALTLAGSDTDLRRDIAEELVEILSSTGGDVTQLLADERAKRKALAAARHARFEPVKPKPVQRVGPKIGRNDPCPCGSGKKFEKCCGGVNAPS